MSIPSFSLIVTAAGSSSRFRDEGVNGGIKKEFMSVNGHSVLYLAVSPFFSIPNLKAVAVTYSKETEAQTEYAMEDLCIQRDIPILMVPGGETRQASVFNALSALDENGISGDFVMIHDGARPFVSAENILQIFGTASIAGAAAGALRIADAVVELDDEGYVKRHVDKSHLFLIQTPQIFRFPDILAAHRKAADAGETFPDDVSIYKKYVGDVQLCHGDERNRKITWPHDLEVL